MLTAMSDSCDKHALDEKRQHPAVEIEQPSSNLGDQPMSRKQALSPYFTIAAAAFGLISDGCRFIFNNLKYDFYSFQRRHLDQNNLMTMANVVTASVLAIRWISLFDLHRSFSGSFTLPRIRQIHRLEFRIPSLLVMLLFQP